MMTITEYINSKPRAYPPNLMSSNETLSVIPKRTGNKLVNFKVSKFLR